MFQAEKQTGKSAHEIDRPGNDFVQGVTLKKSQLAQRKPSFF
jgi:hypothetical protein